MQEEKKTTDIKLKAAKSSSVSGASKGKSKLSGGALVSIVLIVLIIGFCAAVYFNLGGVKQTVAQALGFTTAEAAAQDKSEQDAAAQADFEAQNTEIKNKQQKLSEKEDELDARESELNAREEELTGRENAVTEAEREAAQQAQAQADLAAAAEIFAKMEASAAAKAIAGMDSVEDMAKILAAMPREQAALIMQNMKDALKTDILSVMMK